MSATWLFLPSRLFGFLVMWLLSVILEVCLVRDQSGLYYGRSLSLHAVSSVFISGGRRIQTLLLK